MARVVVAAAKPWNAPHYEEWSRRVDHVTALVRSPEELTTDSIEAFGPDNIFLVHWSWLVPASLYERYECIGFHMSDLPYGRGGSPLQNLIVRGFGSTQISAFRLTRALDAGPVYLKRPLNLEGRAEEIYARASVTCFEMIDEILRERPTPVPQTGEVVLFRRRRPADSAIPADLDLARLYDFIRMLDAPTYPPAFLSHGPHRYELSRAVLHDGHLEAQVRIVRVSSEPST